MAKYCKNCGEKLDDKQPFCSKCGTAQTKEAEYESDAKSKLGAGLLGIFLGSLGVHNFYLGYTNKAIAQILLSTVGWIAFGLGPVAASVWGLIEGIEILAGYIDKDAYGVPLKD